MSKLHQFYEPTPSSPEWKGFQPPHKYEGQDAWSLKLYKYGFCWATNFWAMQKFDEQLLNGSEQCLDWHYKQLSKEEPSYSSEMDCTFTLSPLEGFKESSKLLYLEPWENNPKASWYLDEACGMKWWLCPLWLDLWKGKQAPKECFMYLTLSE